MRHRLVLALLCAAPAVAGPKVAADHRPTEQAPFELVLHDPTGRPAPSTGCDVRLCTSLLEVIEGAERSIDFAFYGVRGQPALFNALVAAKARGVTVRGVIDRELDGSNYYADSEALATALGTVHDDLAVDKRTAEKKAREPQYASKCWMPAPTGFAGPPQCLGYDLGDSCLLAVHASREALEFQGDIMHDKFAVVDGRYVWMGSTNVSDSGTGGYNANVVGLWNSPEIAAWYTAEFEQMYAGKLHGEKSSQRPLVATLGADLRVEGWFSPQDRPITARVRSLLQEARERIDVTIFFLTHKGITADLIAAQRRGVKVRVMLDATGATNEYTKHELLRAAGVPVKVETWGGKLHMKAAQIDGEHLVIGSMNWTSAGEWGNDENTLIVHSRAAAAQYATFYDRLWTALDDRWLTENPDPESKDSTTSCTDGSDNDFDHLADKDDPGCGPKPPPLAALPPWRIVPKADGQGLVKGNVSREGKRSYYIPTDAYYDKVTLNPYMGEQLFCSEDDAKAAGFTRAR